MFKLDFPSTYVSRPKAQAARAKLAHDLDCDLYCSGLKLPNGMHVWRITEPFKGESK